MITRQRIFTEVFAIIGIWHVSSADVVHRDLYSDTWVGTDGAGRALVCSADCGTPRTNRTVGIFYWVNHEDGLPGPFDNTKLIAGAECGDVKWPPKMDQSRTHVCYHHWGEPEFGYYSGTDPFVICKHASMLADAGVDVVFIDTTNRPHTWRAYYEALCKGFSRLRKLGERTPAIAFCCPFDNPYPVLDTLWRDFYTPGTWNDLWFKWDGKPLILANVDHVTNSVQRDFFTWRRLMPDYWKGPSAPNQWGWLEVYPQHVFRNTKGESEQMTVGVAVNAIAGCPGPAPMSDRRGAMGRSWCFGSP